LPLGHQQLQQQLGLQPGMNQAVSGSTAGVGRLGGGGIGPPPVPQQMQMMFEKVTAALQAGMFPNYLATPATLASVSVFILFSE